MPNGNTQTGGHGDGYGSLGVAFEETRDGKIAAKIKKIFPKLRAWAIGNLPPPSTIKDKRVAYAGSIQTIIEKYLVECIVEDGNWKIKITDKHETFALWIRLDDLLNHIES